MLRQFALWCLLGGCCSSWAMAQSDARSYLDRMSHSFRELNYRGVFTYEHGNQIDSLQIVHVVRDGLEKEQLLYLNGEAREVVRDSHALSCVHPGHKMLRLAGGSLARGLVDPSDISQHYRLSFGETARIANRQAVLIEVAPRDTYRYGVRLYLDRETALLLKSLTLSPEGKVLERFQFAQIEIGADIDDSDFSAADSRGRQAFHHDLESPAEDAGIASILLEPMWLPPGFTLSGRSVSSVDAGTAQLSMYSDGISSLTVILEAGDAGVGELDTDGQARSGATVAYTRQLDVEGRPHLLTVVGEVPLATARKVARSIGAEAERT